MSLLSTATNFILVVCRYDLIKLHRQIIHQNDGISMTNSPPAFFFLELKVNNKNDMAALAFLACFCSSRQPSTIRPNS